jgi:hypothetical protein
MRLKQRKNPGFPRRPQPRINNLRVIALQEIFKICHLVQFSQKSVYFYAHKTRISQTRLDFVAIGCKQFQPHAQSCELKADS